MVRTEIANMKSVNFEFLRHRREVLAELAGFAERYAHTDPASSLIKQRSFAEHVVTAIYERELGAVDVDVGKRRNANQVDAGRRL